LPTAKIGAKNNLLLTLHKFARQDEDFTTEAFVNLIRHLQLYDPPIACAVFGFLTNGRLEFTLDDCQKLEISTQNLFMEGRPDILVAGPRHFVIIEVKVESKPGWDQLDRYKALLGTRDELHKHLVLLSRYPVDQKETEKVDLHLEWHRVGRILGQGADQANEESSRFLIRQFLQFLIERGMVMEKVGWELVRGVQSLLTLKNMLREAIRATKVKEREKGTGAENMGCNFTVEQTLCWSGIYYSRPQVLCFEAYAVDKKGAEALGFGQILNSGKKEFMWLNEIDLEAEEVHFFALHEDNQQSQIHHFISRSVSAVKSMN